MKKSIILILLVSIVGSVFLFLRPSQSETAPNTTVREDIKETDIPSAEAETSKPSRLIIEKLNIDTTIEHVGLAPDGRMDVPKEDMHVAWFQHGALPGNMGSSVLAGHFDNRDGGPAIFHRLSELQVGDSIKVITETNEPVEFVVTDIQTYKDATFPIQTVFDVNTRPMLNLITCDGVFDTLSKNYSDRLVVFSELKT